MSDSLRSPTGLACRSHDASYYSSAERWVIIYHSYSPSDGVIHGLTVNLPRRAFKPFRKTTYDPNECLMGRSIAESGKATRTSFRDIVSIELLLFRSGKRFSQQICEKLHVHEEQSVKSRYVVPLTFRPCKTRVQRRDDEKRRA